MKWQGRPKSKNIEYDYGPATTPDPYDYTPSPLSQVPYPSQTDKSKEAKKRINGQNS